MALPQIIMTGTVVDEQPSLRYTASGVPVAQFRVACNRRVQDPTTKEWKDGEVCFLSVEAWRDKAEHIAESIARGVTVTVIGELRERTFETKEGDKRKVYEVINANVAVDLARQVATVEKRTSAYSATAPAPAPAAAAVAPASPPAPPRPVGTFGEPPF